MRVAILVCLCACGRIGFAIPDPLAGDATGADAIGPDASARCGSTDGDTIALFGFDGPAATMVPDALGAHDATVVGGATGAVTGQAGCGDAVRLGGGAHVVIPDSDAWDFAAGSFDFWIRFATDGVTEAVISKEAGGANEPNHMTMLRRDDGFLIVRMQSPNFAPDRMLCSDTVVPSARWTHVAVNLGSPRNELWVDGVLSTRTDQLGFFPPGGFDQLGDCNTDAAIPLAGNSNPITFGAGQVFTADGAGTPVVGAVEADVDHLRISGVRRDFSR